MNEIRSGVRLKDHTYRGHRLTSERGQALYLIVSFVVVLMAFASLGVDIAMLWGIQLRMQNAADAAALAGADSLFGGGSGNITAAGRAGSAQNGFTNALGTTGNANLVSVTMNNPPKTGSYTSNSQAVEAIVLQTQPTFFMRVAGFSSFPISGRAVSLTSSGTNCIYAMNPAASGALLLNSGGKITAGCGLMVNSSSSSAITVNSGATLTASAVGMVGGTLNNGGTISPAPVTGITAFGDPLSAIQPPSIGTCVTAPTCDHGATTNPRLLLRIEHQQRWKCDA